MDTKNLQQEYNLWLHSLVERSVKNQEAKLGPNGALLVNTGKYNGRCPKDRFLVEEETSKNYISWGKINQKISRKNFDKITDLAMEYAKDKNFFTNDCFCGADRHYRIGVRFLTEMAWHSIFIRNMFINPKSDELDDFKPDFTVINVGNMFLKNYQEYGLRSEVFILFDFERKIGIIGGSNYSGEMKKGIFSYMNYILPFKNVLPMHCSANKDEKGNVALFFGLSGTGKTTLSADNNRILIGDDEHGWSNTGIFNFEGGCYAKAIALNPVREPAIWNAIRYGSILENVVYDSYTRDVDFNDASITENTRISYPINFVKKADLSGQGGHPRYIIFLTVDASGVLPPVARLTPQQAEYHFLSGYTSKIPGTESGLTEIKKTFSSCFGEPFMVQAPEVYGKLLHDKIKKHKCDTFLVNTGWFGGAHGQGKRINLATTRKIITSILDGSIKNGVSRKDDVFGFEAIHIVPKIEQDLNPMLGWNSSSEYQEARKKLAAEFIENFKRFGNLENIKKGNPQL